VRTFILFPLVLFLAGLGHPLAAGAASDADAKFQALADEFIKGYLAWRPQMGTGLGLHEYDGRITDLSRPSLEAELARLKEFDRRMDGLPTNGLSAQAHYDLRIVRAALRKEVLTFDDRRSYTQQPMSYAGALNVNIYIKRDFAPLTQRVASVVAILNQAPALFAAARTNLELELAKPFVDTAIEVADGLAEFLVKDLNVALKDFREEPLRSQLQAAN